MLIERLGYHLTTTNSSVQALELFRNAPETFDLIITDFTMPQMNGYALSQAIHKIRPNIPIILCTGYSDQLTDEKIKRSGINALVMKPFVYKDFAKIIRHSLDKKDCSLKKT